MEKEELEKFLQAFFDEFNFVGFEHQLEAEALKQDIREFVFNYFKK